MYDEIKTLHEYNVKTKTSKYKGMIIEISMPGSDVTTVLTGKDAEGLISICDKYINDKFEESKK